jgi:glutamine amidotransferase-like uncharacterized protein
MVWRHGREVCRVGLLLLVVALVLAGPLVSALSPGDAKVRVGLLSDPGCTDERSREAVWRILNEQPDFAPCRVTAAEIRDGGALGAMDVLVLPGGTGGGQGKALGVEGGRRVTAFAAAGGGVIAICAGGYLVVEGWNAETRAIDLINAQTFDDAHWARGEGFITVEVLDEGSSSPASADGGSTRTMWFENGPLFVPRGQADRPAYAALVRYVSDLAAPDAPTGMMRGRDAIIAAPFGRGRVVAFGPHAELSPGLHHWLAHAVRWAAGRRPLKPMTAAHVLEGQ